MNSKIKSEKVKRNPPPPHHSPRLTTYEVLRPNYLYHIKVQASNKRRG